MSHQSAFNGPDILDAPLDFLSRLIRGFILWPIVAAVSMLITAPLIISIADSDVANPTQTGLVLTFLVICIWSPGVAMAATFAHRDTPRLPWGNGRGWDDPPDDPTPPPPRQPSTPIDLSDDTTTDSGSWVPDPAWFSVPAPDAPQEKQMNQ